MPTPAVTTATAFSRRAAIAPAAHVLYAQRVAALRDEIQRRVDTRLAQGFTAGEALSYAAPLLRAARRGRVLHAACLLELTAEHAAL